MLQGDDKNWATTGFMLGWLKMEVQSKEYSKEGKEKVQIGVFPFWGFSQVWNPKYAYQISYEALNTKQWTLNSIARPDIYSVADI